MDMMKLLPFGLLSLISGLTGCGPVGGQIQGGVQNAKSPRETAQDSLTSRKVTSGWVRLQGEWVQRQYEVRGSVAYVDGHIRVPEGSFRDTRPADEPQTALGLVAQKAASGGNAIDTRFLWPGMRVPYRIAADVDEIRRQAIMSAIAQFTERTPILFEPAVSTDLRVMNIRFDPEAPPCAAAALGFQPTFISSAADANDIIMANLDACKFDLRLSANITHEMAHAIGMDHEWSRPDRDDFLGFNTSNMRFPQGAGFNDVFYKTTDRYVSGVFDPNAITMYFPYLFSLAVTPSIPLIYLKNGSDPNANPPRYNVDFSPMELSRGDRVSISELYASQGAPIIGNLSDISMPLNASQSVDFSIAIAAPAAVSCSSVSVSPLDATVLSAAVTTVSPGMCRITLASKAKPGYAEVEVKLAKNPGSAKPQASSRVFTVKLGNPVATPGPVQLATRVFTLNLPRQRTVSAIKVTDADVGEKFTFSLSGPDAASFVVLGGHLVSSVTLSKQKYDLTITARDRSGLTSASAVSVCVDPAQCPEPPIAIDGEKKPDPSEKDGRIVVDADKGVAPMWINFRTEGFAPPSSGGPELEWVFESGLSVKAEKVSRYFVKPGEVRVNLKITHQNGSSYFKSQTITLASPSK
jgi:hypothetical protein